MFNNNNNNNKCNELFFFKFNFHVRYLLKLSNNVSQQSLDAKNSSYYWIVDIFLSILTDPGPNDSAGWIFAYDCSRKSNFCDEPTLTEVNFCEWIYGTLKRITGSSEFFWGNYEVWMRQFICFVFLFSFFFFFSIFNTSRSALRVNKKGKN